MSKHTPGPWVISNNSAFLIRAGDADTGRHIAQVGPANYHPSFAVDEPNARLIAASPTLLAELQETHAALCFTADYIGSLRYERNKAAIELAGGEP